MKKEIKEVDKKRGIFRVTLADERWYTKEEKNKETGLPEFSFIPSVTWISSFFPKGIQFYKWLADKGWDEAEAIKVSAGNKGSRVHRAIELLITGNEIKMDEKLPNENDELEELTVEEYECLLSFSGWYKKFKPEFLLNESVVISKKHNYAGTIDCLAKISGQTYIIDFKTSQYIWPEQEIQISAYKQGLIEEGKIKEAKLAILQLGYKKNKQLYKFTEIEDKFNLFLNTRAIWEAETKNQNPKQYEYPLFIKLENNETTKGN